MEWGTVALGEVEDELAFLIVAMDEIRLIIGSAIYANPGIDQKRRADTAKPANHPLIKIVQLHFQVLKHRSVRADKGNADPQQHDHGKQRR